jgi:hypothetical protein
MQLLAFYSIETHICALPRLARQETPDAPKPRENDLADYVCRFGFDDELRAALRVPLPLTSIMLTRGGVSAPALQLDIERHCAESDASIAAVQRAIGMNSRLFLSAPTGSGKTFLMLRHIAMQHRAETGGRVVFVVPTIALAEQIEHEYSGNPLCDLPHSGIPLMSITGADTALALLEARTSSKIIVCTYDSLPKILYAENGLLNEEHLLLIVDEAHKMFTDYAYRSGAMRGVMTAIERVSAANASNRVVCMSATPNLFLHYVPVPVPDKCAHFTYLHLRARAEQERRIAFHPYQCREQEAANAILREMQHGTVVVRINSEAALKTIQTLLIRAGVTPDDIDLITSRRRASSPEYKRITRESRTTCRVILTTSLLDCGVNIMNTDIRAALIFDERDPEAIVQFASRFRAMPSLNVMLFHKQTAWLEAPTQHRLFPLSLEQMFQSNYFQAEMRAAEYNASPYNAARAANHQVAVSKAVGSAVGKRSAFRRFDQSMMYDAERKAWAPDLTGIIAGLCDLRRSTLARADLENELREYGMTIVEQDALFEKLPAPSASLVREEFATISGDAVAALKASAAEQAKLDDCLLRTMLAETPELFLEAVWHTTASRTVRTAITALFPAHHWCAGIRGKPRDRTKSEGCERLLGERAALFSTPKPETLAARYLHLRRRLLTHDEAARLVERYADSRSWVRFTEHLAMHQRLELKRLQLHTKLLNPHELKKLERESEIRSFVANAATVGFMFHGAGANNAPRHIPFALHRAEDVAARVNAFTDDTFRLTKQRAGELVNALFYVEYKREREVKDNGTTGFGGYYAFQHDENGICIKTLADFVDECGVDGSAYAERFGEMMRVAPMVRNSEAKKERVCAVSSL